MHPAPSFLHLGQSSLELIAPSSVEQSLSKMETVVKKIVPGEDKVEVENYAGIEDGGDEGGEIGDCTENEENGDEHGGEDENEADNDCHCHCHNGEDGEDGKKKKEIVFDNDEVIKKAFQGDETHMLRCRKMRT